MILVSIFILGDYEKFSASRIDTDITLPCAGTNLCDQGSVPNSMSPQPRTSQHPGYACLDVREVTVKI